MNWKLTVYYLLKRFTSGSLIVLALWYKKSTHPIRHLKLAVYYLSSTNRSHLGLPFYQTDAAVNPGNSGGPVFDKKGNVIAITVAGIFTRDGGSKNINYLIPIESALEALGITQR